VCKVLRADGLVYQAVDDLLAVGRALNPAVTTFDAACFDAHYVTGDIDLDYLDALEKGRGAGRDRAGQTTSLVGAAPAAAA
jgi:amidophosphoribosyltransferase